MKPELGRVRKNATVLSSASVQRPRASSFGLIHVQSFNYFQLHAVRTFSPSLPHPKTKSYYIAQAKFLCSPGWPELLIDLLPQTLEDSITKAHFHARLPLTSKSMSLTQTSFSLCALDASCQVFPTGCPTGFRTDLGNM